ncbi:hypothetical protein [Streptomyces sp. NPDC048650]|uniref:hypothetical protein n=1 Tax=Streptomyces sp. NPDC048650 TaxID=3365583 RepID=UPI0037203527
MHTLTFADSSVTFALTDRPTAEDFEPLPYGLSLDDAVAVRAHEVKAGDLVVAQFSDGTGVRPTEHAPTPFPADPHTVSDCPCEGCEECDNVDGWTMTNPDRVADVGWRFVCLHPSEPGDDEYEDEPCVIALRNRPVVVIPVSVVADARQAAEEAKPPVRMYGVTWSDDFEASSPEEAARLAYEQLKSYATDGWPPVLEVTGEGNQMTVVDLNAGNGVQG